MKNQVVIFGTGDIAQLAHFYFSTDSSYEVVAFTVDAEYLDATELCGLPVVPFDEVHLSYPPSDCHFFVALSYSKLNSVRDKKYQAAKNLGYAIASYVSSHATVLNEFYIGENCFILEDNTIQPFVEIGNNVTLWSGNHIGHHSKIEEHAFITSHVVISGGVTVGHHSFIGVNATLRDHINIGALSVIGAGAIIMSDTEEESVYVPERTVAKKIKSSRLKGL